MRDVDRPIAIVLGGLGTGPLARHPAANLGPDEQEVLGWMVEGKAGLPIELSERLEEGSPSTVADLEDQIRELVAGGYVQRVSEAPLKYQVTPAGVDAAIGYGALTPAPDKDQDARKEATH